MKQGFAGYRSVPKKITLLGDRNEAQKYIGEADSQLALLEKQLSFQHINIGSRRVQLKPDVHIEVRSSYALKEVIIRIGREGERNSTQKRQCFCNCNFSIGQIIGKDTLPKDIQRWRTVPYRKDRYVEIRKPERTITDTIGEWRNHQFSIPIYNSYTFYTVQVCVHEDTYIAFSYLLATDYADYPVGAIVVVVAYNIMDFTKCPAVFPRNKSRASGCAPSAFSGFKGVPAYRIAPLCGTEMKRWLK